MQSEVHSSEEGASRAPELQNLVARSKARLLKMHYQSGVGHIGGNLSCLDTLIVLHHAVLSSNDLFLLSKGHAAGALYITYWSLGWIAEEELSTFHQENTRLSGHPAPGQFPSIPFATGSLGHAFSLAAGIALGRKLQNQPGRIYCLLSDGEWQEGSNWEALIFVAHHHLDITFLIDANGLQGFGTTGEIASQDSLAEKFQAFHIPVQEIDGHSVEALLSTFAAVSSGPHAIICHTLKGNGVSFMENRMEWHYLPLTEAQYLQALHEVETR